MLLCIGTIPASTFPIFTTWLYKTKQIQALQFFVATFLTNAG